MPPPNQWLPSLQLCPRLNQKRRELNMAPQSTSPRAIRHFCIFKTRNYFQYTDQSSPQFISSRGNEYFCEIDEEYLTDRFNLTGLQQEVQYYQYALDLVTDV